MFGVRLSSLFTSRWFALLWAVLVILTAIQFVGGSAKQSDAGAANGTDTAAGVSADGLTDDQKSAIRNAF